MPTHPVLLHERQHYGRNVADLNRQHGNHDKDAVEEGAARRRRKPSFSEPLILLAEERKKRFDRRQEIIRALNVFRFQMDVTSQQRKILKAEAFLDCLWSVISAGENSKENLGLFHKQIFFFHQLEADLTVTKAKSSVFL